MQAQQDTTTRSSPTRRRLLMPALCVLSALMLSVAVPAQDSDDDGVLPTGSPGGDQQAGGGGGSSIASTAATTVGVTASMDDGQLAPEMASLSLTSLAGDTDVATDVDAADATFVSETAGMTIAQAPGEVSLQGRGMLLLQPNLLPLFRAPDDSVAGGLVLILDDGSESLDDVKNGDTQPLFIALLGDPDSFDLNHFHKVATSHADDLPGISATLVFVSRDGDGVLHTSAVRVSTSGGPIEVVIE